MRSQATVQVIRPKTSQGSRRRTREENVDDVPQTVDRNNDRCLLEVVRAIAQQTLRHQLRLHGSLARAPEEPLHRNGDGEQEEGEEKHAED